MDKQTPRASSIELEVDQNGVATLWLNRPDKHNAFNDAMIQTLINKLEKIAAEPAIRMLILRAKGKSFCAGADLNWMQCMANYSQAENYQDALTLAQLMSTLYHLNKPTIAIVHGAAYGGGVGLVACCDIVIATEQAKFCFSEAKVGLIPATISPYVIDAIGRRHAKRYFLSAEVINAERALQLGLVHETITETKLADSLENLTQHILQNGPMALTSCKQLLNQTLGTVSDNKLNSQLAQLIAEVRVSPEGQAGLHAFLEKRQADWNK